jgi:hypothetical protein
MGKKRTPITFPSKSSEALKRKLDVMGAMQTSYTTRITMASLAAYVKGKCVPSLYAAIRLEKELAIDIHGWGQASASAPKSLKAVRRKVLKAVKKVAKKTAKKSEPKEAQDG